MIVTYGTSLDYTDHQIPVESPWNPANAYCEGLLIQLPQRIRTADLKGTLEDFDCLDGCEKSVKIPADRRVCPSERFEPTDLT